ncbi:hypothetical protein C8F04DRAFT_1232669 [Mycena alexandri]|uniref:Mitochondrial splicing suppressor 51-like C-terminal domain-containing protein n=1 Tax=Mycena alexandri TaxID=1745969 RepID=A0AAD6X9M8_9AGAR|nr:hypothetical protein C8F04DRAFT_1232669 [Mycena alexandri]
MSPNLVLQSRLPESLKRPHFICQCPHTAHQVDWKIHKPMCKALSAIKKSNPIAAAMLLSTVPSELTTDVDVLNDISARHISSILKFCRRSVQRSKVMFEPRCMVCTRTDQMIRMEAAMMGATIDNSRRLVPCPQCKLSFCCSTAHWKAARALHHDPCDDADYGHARLSQCEINREIRAHVKFQATLVDKDGHFQRLRWAPPRVKAAWRSLTASSWDGQFEDEIRTFLRVPASFPLAPWIRAASDDLTMPMTILYGLEKLNDDDGWTRKQTLAIHVTDHRRQPYRGQRHHGLRGLHRLPEVKILKVVQCGPDVPRGSPAQKMFSLAIAVFVLSVVASISRSAPPSESAHIPVEVTGTQIVLSTYHQFMANKGSEFEKPDLCIAFNSGAPVVSSHTWLPTVKVLVERKIPTLFTAFSREEAEGEAALLRAAGARLHPDLGPAKNPWGSMKLTPAHMKLYGFSADSGWLAGGFSFTA